MHVYEKINMKKDNNKENVDNIFLYINFSRNFEKKKITISQNINEKVNVYNF